MPTLFIETLDGTRFAISSLAITDLLSKYKLSNSDLTFLHRGLELEGFAGIYQKREEDECDNLNYLYISYFAPNDIEKAFSNIKDCYLTLA
jgi:hypothetical protein